jgi:hypothetical protein
VARFANLYLSFHGLKIIFDEYYDSPQYHIVESILKLKIQSGRIALFKIPYFRSRLKIQEVREMISDYELTPE